MSGSEGIAPTVHGTALVLDGRGVLIRGPSGAGKSLLALALLDAWEARGAAAMLVADDRVGLDRADGAVVLRAPERIAGLIELRGRGIVARAYLPKAKLDLVVDLVDELERLPEEAEFQAIVMETEVVRCPVPRAGLVPLWHQMLLIKEALRAMPDEKPVTRQKDT